MSFTNEPSLGLLRDSLECILEALSRIERYTRNIDKVTFLENELTQDAVMRNFSLYAEILKNLDHEIWMNFWESCPTIPIRHLLWGGRGPLMLGIALNMTYEREGGIFEVDLEKIWEAIQNDLSERAAVAAVLLEQVEALLRQENVVVG